MVAKPGYGLRVVQLDEARWAFKENTKGNRLKKFCIPSNRIQELEASEGWFWKASDTKYPHEFWSEILACRIGAELGVPVPCTHLGILDGQSGSLAASMLAQGEELIEAADIFAELDDKYERRGKGERQTIALSLRAVERIWGKLQAPALEPFHRMLVFDCLIGNQDRHHENWGFIQSSEEGIRHRFADVFDNGSSLLRELVDDDALRKRLGDPSRIAAYAAKATSEIRWIPGGKITHFDLFRNCVRELDGFRPVAERILSVEMERLSEIIREVAVFSRDCGVEPAIDPLREGILVAVLSERRKQMIERLS